MAERPETELIDLLEEQRDAYELLLSLSKGQLGAFEEGGAGALMKVLARKQEVINRLSKTQRRLRPCTSRWEETVSALGEEERREVSGLVDETASIIAGVLRSEEEAESAVEASRDALSSRMRGVSDGLAAARAYARPAASSSGRIIDREG